MYLCIFLEGACLYIVGTCKTITDNFYINLNNVFSRKYEKTRTYVECVYLSLPLLVDLTTSVSIKQLFALGSLRIPINANINIHHYSIHKHNVYV